MAIDYLKSIIDMIDRKRRDACNQTCYGEGSQMYYEGMRVGLAEAQAFAEKMKDIHEQTGDI